MRRRVAETLTTFAADDSGVPSAAKLSVASREHRLRSEARVQDGRLIYDANTQADLGLTG